MSPKQPITTPQSFDAFTASPKGEAGLNRLPHSLTAPPESKGTTVYEQGSSATVPIMDKFLGPALDTSDLDPLLVADFKDRHDHVGLPAIEEAMRADRMAWARMKAWNDRAAVHNKPILDQIEMLEKAMADLVNQYAAFLVKNGQAKMAALLLCASSCAQAKMCFDGTQYTPVVQDGNRRKSAEAIAAEMKLPKCDQESVHFLPPWAEMTGYGIVSVVTGISAASAFGALHLRALGHEWPIAIAGAIAGCAITAFGGWFVKLIWRLAAESFYLGKKRDRLLAAVGSLALFLVETSVDVQGIKNSAMVHAETQAISGAHPASGDTSTISLYLVAALFSFAYITYSAVKGWMYERSTAANLIRLAQETELIDMIEEVRELPEYIGVLESGNKVAAIDVGETAQGQTFEKVRSLYEKRAEELKAKLMEVRDLPLETDVAIVENARNKATGLWGDLEKRKDALLGNQPRRPDQKPAKPSSMIESIRAFFKRSDRSRGGG